MLSRYIHCSIHPIVKVSEVVW